MSARKGFTLIELIMVLVILGILAKVAVTSYSNIIEQNEALAAENNLITIYNGQKTYHYNTGTYCYVGGTGGATEATINAALGLNISDPYYAYSCSCLPGVPVVGQPCTDFSCNASKTLNAKIFIQTVYNRPIVLSGGANCANSMGAGCNPQCGPQLNFPSLCPTS